MQRRGTVAAANPGGKKKTTTLGWVAGPGGGFSNESHWRLSPTAIETGDGGGLRQTNNNGLALQCTQTWLMSGTITSVSASRQCAANINMRVCGCVSVCVCVHILHAYIYLYICLMLTQSGSPATSDNDTAGSLCFYD